MQGMEAQTRLEAVFDCNVFLRAIARRRGPAFEIVRLLGIDAYTLFVSRDVLRELRRVLSRADVRQHFPGITDADVDELFRRLDEKAILIYNVPETFRYPRDPKDEPYINLALVTNAQYLVTYDNDLLDLMNEQTEQGSQFRHQFPHLMILDPAAFLQVLRGA